MSYGGQCCWRLICIYVYSQILPGNSTRTSARLPASSASTLAQLPHSMAFSGRL